MPDKMMMTAPVAIEMLYDWGLLTHRQREGLLKVINSGQKPPKWLHPACAKVWFLQLAPMSNSLH